MQTRTPSFRSVSFIAKRVCALLCTAILMPALTACSMPRIAGRAEAEQRQSPCEKAYFDATADNKIAHDQHQHIIRRYFSAQQAVSASVFLFWAWAFSRGLLRPASCSLLRQ